MIPNPNDLIDKIKMGDKSAYQVLFNEYYAELCRFALLYTKDKDAAEEVVQNFFVQFWIKKDNISISSSIKSYMYSAVRNASFNYLRDKKKLSSIDDNIDYFENLISKEDNQNDIDLKDLNIKISAAIEDLPPKCRDIFKLSRVENLTYREIAEKLSISQKTVENQIGIALKKLHEQLRPYYEILLILLLFIKQLI
jgi:RNA polymerase sigma-70 factor, ECF subfamily